MISDFKGTACDIQIISFQDKQILFMFSILHYEICILCANTQDKSAVFCKVQKIMNHIIQYLHFLKYKWATGEYQYFY